MSAIGKKNDQKEFDFMIKMLMLGDSNVGKSSILLRYIDDTFNTDILNTIGVDYKVKMIDQEDGKRIKLAIWDTAGQERFRTLTASYYRGANGIVLVYDCANRATFVNCKMWLEDIQKNLPGKEISIILVCNKIDLEQREVQRDEGEQLASDHGMVYVEASAKTREGITHVFDQLVDKVMNSSSFQAPPPNRGDNTRRAALSGGVASQESSCCI